MQPTHDPATLFPMPNTNGASFQAPKEQDAQAVSARLLGHDRCLPVNAPAAGGASWLSLRASTRKKQR